MLPGRHTRAIAHAENVNCAASEVVWYGIDEQMCLSLPTAPETHQAHPETEI
jgi:hypothetical protein